MRAAEDLLNASSMTRSSIRFASAGGQVGWMTNTSAPRTFSRIWQYASPSAKRRHSVRPNGIPRKEQISLASAGWALPVNTVRPFMSAELISWRPLPRTRLRPVVGAGGFEPPVLDPKSSVLPLDDAPRDPSGAARPKDRRRSGRRAILRAVG